MAIRASTQRALEQVERLSGKPVLVRADSSISLLATVHMARGAAPAHLILYKSSAASAADYLISYQCGLMLRVFSVPEQERFDVAGTYWGKKEAGRLLTDHLRKPEAPQVPREMRNNLRDQMYDGLIRQLRSAPIGLRVDEWISKEFPDLAEQQRASNVQQLNENAAALKPEVKKLAPEHIYYANVAMNAAIAAYWSRLWSEEPHKGVYRASGHLDKGVALLDIWDNTPDDPSQDRSLIDAWGQRLGLSKWFEFVPYYST